MFVVVEGLDGAGGKTLTDALDNHYRKQGVPCHLMRYPEYDSPWGKIIQSYLDGRLDIDPKPLFVTYAADQLKDQKAIRRWKTLGGIILCDRYVTSAIAYETALGLSYMEALKITDAFDFVFPDMILYLDITTGTSYKRKKKEKGESIDIHESNIGLLQKVRRNYQRMIEDKLFCHWHQINADHPIEKVFEIALGMIETQMDKRV